MDLSSVVYGKSTADDNGLRAVESSSQSVIPDFIESIADFRL